MAVDLCVGARPSTRAARLLALNERSLLAAGGRRSRASRASARKVEFWMPDVLSSESAPVSDRRGTTSGSPTAWRLDHIRRTWSWARRFRGRSDLTSHRAQPDVVLMDFRLTDGPGPMRVTAIREVRPETSLIFLTRETATSRSFCGHRGWSQRLIHKSRAAGEVVDAIRTVAGGGSLFTRAPSPRSSPRRKEVESQLEDSPS